MIELQRKTSATGRTQSIGDKKNSVQEKVEQKIKQDVLAKLVNEKKETYKQNVKNRTALEVAKTAPEPAASEEMAQTMPQPSS